MTRCLFDDHMRIPALPAKYNGITFRSRTEARWAVFFDFAGIPFQYEPEAYPLPSGNYLPDFLLELPNRKAWFEVKGQRPDETEIDKLRELSLLSGCEAYITIGAPVSPSFESILLVREWVDHGPFAFVRCGTCHAVDVVFEGRRERLRCCEAPTTSGSWEPHASAAEAARVASFWRPPRAA